MQGTTIDLERLGLRSGQARSLQLELEPDAPVLGGVDYPIEGGAVATRIEASRTTSGYALRLLAAVTLVGPCARCLEPSETELSIEAREVDQPGAGDAELRSPYVEESVLDPIAWLHDAITLALPEKVLCRPDCLGICEICGVSLNEAGPDHAHERPPDPRFAKLRELREKR